MGHLNHAHVAKQPLKPDRSADQSAVKQRLVMKTLRTTWPADVRLRQKRHRATLKASRARCGVHHTCSLTLITEVRLEPGLCPAC